MTATHELPSLPGFTIEGSLGHGGSAEVFLCRQHRPSRRVAVKVLKQVVANEEAKARFVREGDLLATLSNHPAIVTIHETGVTPDERPYLVMEYCSQPSLAERVSEKPLTVPELLQTMIRLAGAVETAHRSGIIHRDIKPANVLTTDYGWPALADFGISELLDDSTPGTTAMSVPWAAPEVLRDASPDARSDVYSLGATAYTLLAGHSPHEPPGETMELEELIHRVLEAPIPPIHRRDVPDSLARLIQVSLAREASHRHQTVSEFAHGLQRIEQDMNVPMTHFDIPAPEGPSGTHLDDGEEATRLRSGVGAEIGDETRIVNRSYSLEQETVMRPRTVSSADPPTREAPADATVVVSRSETAPLPRPERTVVSSSTTRIAFDPGQDGVDQTVYGTRSGRGVAAGSLDASAVASANEQAAPDAPVRNAGQGSNTGQTLRRRLLLVGVIGSAALVLFAGALVWLITSGI